MRRQFKDLLTDIGFVQRGAEGEAEANAHSGNERLVKAVLCAGLYPNAASVRHSHGRSAGKRPPRLYTKEDGKVALHPRSVLANEVYLPTKWLIYHQKVKSTKVFLYDATMIAPYPLIFFGGRIATGHDEGQELITVDDDIKFRAPAKIATLVLEMRKQLDALLGRKIQHPSISLSHVGAKLIRTCIELITNEVR